jgi:hypothetical protein
MMRRSSLRVVIHGHFLVKKCPAVSKGLMYSLGTFCKQYFVAPMAQLHPLSQPNPLTVKAILHPVVIEVDSSPALASMTSSQSLMAVEAQPVIATVLAQGKEFDQDVLGDMARLWNTFIETGQVWALLIGLVLGYAIRGITTYN